MVTGTLTRALYAFALAQMGRMACAASGSYVGETLGPGPHYTSSDDSQGGPRFIAIPFTDRATRTVEAFGLGSGAAAARLTVGRWAKRVRIRDELLVTGAHRDDDEGAISAAMQGRTLNSGGIAGDKKDANLRTPSRGVSAGG